MSPEPGEVNRGSKIHIWLAFGLTVLFAIVFAASERRTFEIRHASMITDNETATYELDTRLHTTIDYLSLLGEDLLDGSPTEDSFRSRARSFIESHGEIVAIGWRSEKQGIHWLSSQTQFPIPLRLEVLQHAVEHARSSQHAEATRVYRDFNGHKYFALIVPIYEDDEFLGFLFAIFSLEKVIDVSIPRWINDLYDIQIVTTEGITVANEGRVRSVNEYLKSLSPPLAFNHNLRIRLQRYSTGTDWQVVLLAALSLGMIIGIAISVRELNIDRRHKRQIAHDMQAARDLAEAASRYKSEFVANVSHELRTPLTAILGYSDLLLHHNVQGQEATGTMEAISRNGRHLLLLINDLLDHSKMEAGFLDIHPEPLNLRPFIEDLLLSFHFKEKYLRLSFGTKGPVPLTIETDPLRLRQILTNLIANGIKFTDEGEVRLTARIETHPNSKQLVFEVRDSGQGIAIADQDRIFSPFVRSGKEKQIGGTGLGLAISRKLAELLNGELQLVESQPGSGSLFRLTLPLTPSANADQDTAYWEVGDIEAQEPAIAPSSGRLKDLRLLIVDDSIDNQNLLRVYLQSEGALLSFADSAEAALSLVDPTFHLIIMDIQLPGMNGYDASREIRRRGLEMPILALTANTFQGEEARSREAGCQAYLPKPFDPVQLVDWIARLTRSETPPASQRSTEQATQEGFAALPSVHRSNPALQAVIESFVKRLGERLTELHQAIEGRNYDKVARWGHTVKGTAANFGYPELAQLGAALERAAKQEKVDIPHLHDLEKEAWHLTRRIEAGLEQETEEG